MDHHGLRYVYVAGTPALTQDSIDALLQRLPLMTIILVLVTGSSSFWHWFIVRRSRPRLVSALGLGATLGI